MDNFQVSRIKTVTSFLRKKKKRLEICLSDEEGWVSGDTFLYPSHLPWILEIMREGKKIAWHLMSIMINFIL